jgi:23S rRNA (cytidine1920-2'-O)/16S rRNA (cytidine1409-2'-O)-methyltransferase
MDRVNVRNLKLDQLSEQPDLVTADLSFISLTTVLSSLIEIIHPAGDLILMVKPQFEVGRDLVGDGVVLDLDLRRGAVLQVADAAWALGWGVVGHKQSDIHGPSGNKEVFLWLRKDGNQLMPDNLILETEDGLNE